MSEQTPTPGISRILVALEDTHHCLSTLDTAAQLAARMRAELLGMFVEDINLLQLAALPFTHEIPSSSGEARHLDPAGMESALKAKANRLHRTLADVAERQQVRWSFQVVRGQVMPSLLAAIHEVDILVVGRMGHSASMRRSQYTVALPTAKNDGAVVTLFDGSAATVRSLATALRLALEDDGKLTLLLPAKDEEQLGHLRAQADTLLQDGRLKKRYVRLRSVDTASLAHATSVEGGRLLVLPSDIELLATPSQADTLLNALECPLALAR